MTIALGILATDGLVVAADTQVTVPGYLKYSQGKLVWTHKTSVPLTGHDGQMITSGAGAETSLKHLWGKLHQSFWNGSVLMSPVEMHDELERQIADFHAKHVTPHGAGGVLDVWLLVGCVDSKTGRKLWTTDKSVVTEESLFGAVGIGSAYARIIMSQMFAPMNTLGAILLSAYIVWRVKGMVDGVGDKTDIVGIGPKKIHRVSRVKARELEDIFEEMDSNAAYTLHSIFCDQIGFGRHRNISTETRKLRKRVENFIESIGA